MFTLAKARINHSKKHKAFWKIHSSKRGLRGTGAGVETARCCDAEEGANEVWRENEGVSHRSNGFWTACDLRCAIAERHLWQNFRKALQTNAQVALGVRKSKGFLKTSLKCVACKALALRQRKFALQTKARVALV